MRVSVRLRAHHACKRACRDATHRVSRARVRARGQQRRRDARVAADQVREVARDFRAFSRREDTRLEPVDVRRVVETSLRMAGTELRERAEVVTEFGEVPPVEATAARLGQVFLNLLINALSVSKDGGEVRLTVRLDGADAVATIDDDGPGFAAEILPRLFGVYETTRAAEGGTGLGLNLCARIAREHHGNISVENRPEGGARLILRLPRMQAAARTR